MAPDPHLRRLHGRGLSRRDRGRAPGADGGGAVAGDEPRPGDAIRDRPPGGPQGDPAAPQRLHCADEGHLARRVPRRARGGPGRSRRPERALQRLGARARRDPLPDRHDPARAAGRLADLARAGSAPQRGGAPPRGARPPAGTAGWQGASGRERRTRCSSSRTCSKRFGELEVLRGVDLDVERGRGRLRDRPERLRASRRCCAASTCSSPPRRGTIFARGHAEITRRGGDAEGTSTPSASRVGMVFQQFNLFPHKTALENVGLGPDEGARPQPARRARRPRRCSTASGWPTSWTSTRTGSPAASSSAWRSPARWRWTRT